MPFEGKSTPSIHKLIRLNSTGEVSSESNKPVIRDSFTRKCFSKMRETATSLANSACDLQNYFFGMSSTGQNLSASVTPVDANKVTNMHTCSDVECVNMDTYRPEAPLIASYSDVVSGSKPNTIMQGALAGKDRNPTINHLNDQLYSLSNYSSFPTYCHVLNCDKRTACVPCSTKNFGCVIPINVPSRCEDPLNNTKGPDLDIQFNQSGCDPFKPKLYIPPNKRYFGERNTFENHSMRGLRDEKKHSCTPHSKFSNEKSAEKGCKTRYLRRGNPNERAPRQYEKEKHYSKQPLFVERNYDENWREYMPNMSSAGQSDPTKYCEFEHDVNSTFLTEKLADVTFSCHVTTCHNKTSELMSNNTQSDLALSQVVLEKCKDDETNHFAHDDDPLTCTISTSGNTRACTNNKSLSNKPPLLTGYSDCYDAYTDVPTTCNSPASQPTEKEPTKLPKPCDKTKQYDIKTTSSISSCKNSQLHVISVSRMGTTPSTTKQMVPPLNVPKKNKGRPSSQKRRRIKRQKGIVFQKTKFSDNPNNEKSQTSHGTKKHIHVKTMAFIAHEKSVAFIIGAADDTDSSSGWSDNDADWSETESGGDDSDLLDEFSLLNDPFTSGVFNVHVTCSTLPIESNLTVHSRPDLDLLNQQWDATHTPQHRHTTSPKAHKVSFATDNNLSTTHPLIVWDFAYRAARKAPWEQYARDRCRFESRIREVGKSIEYCLEEAHRMQIIKTLQEN